MVDEPTVVLTVVWYSGNSVGVLILAELYKAGFVTTQLHLLV